MIRFKIMEGKDDLEPNLVEYSHVGDQKVSLPEESEVRRAEKDPQRQLRGSQVHVRTGSGLGVGWTGHGFRVARAGRGEQGVSLYCSVCFCACSTFSIQN